MHSDREKLVERLRERAEYHSRKGADYGSTRPLSDNELKTAELLREAIAALSEPVKDEPVAVRPLDDDQIMEIIKEVAPWKDEPKLNDLLTYEKSVPLFPQATYDVPSYRAAKFVRAVEARVRSAVTRPAGERPAVAVKPLEWHPSNTGVSGDTHTTPTLYTVRFVDDRDGWRWMGLGGHGYEVTAEAAKAAAQADYERRIRSALTAEPQAVPEGMVLVPTGIELRADEWLGELIYRALYEHEGGKWAAVEPRYVWYNAGARFRAMLAASPAVQGGQ